MSTRRDELHQLIDALPEDQVEGVIGALLHRVGTPRPTSADAFAWIGAGVAANGRSDNATRADDLLAEGFGRG
ncbi:hypothetical protein [Nocardioides dubius]